jgi:hypothetical protein
LVSFDLDHDGSPDFGLSNRWFYHSTTGAFANLQVFQSPSPNEIWMTNSKACGGTYPVAAALPKGKTIGPKGEFKHSPYGAVMAAATKATTCGVWAGQSNLQAYLGLKFTINGKIHFGLGTSESGHAAPTIFSYPDRLRLRDHSQQVDPCGRD